MLDAAFEASWPAAEYASAGAIRIGRAPGGGDRVNSARPIGSDWTEGDLDQATAIQTNWNQPPLFRVADGDPLAAALLARGWQAQKPTRLLAAPLLNLTDIPVPRVTAFAVWPPLAIQRNLWTETGIDAGRQAVMDRVSLPKAAILGRAEDRAAGMAFVAVDGPVAVLHALEIIPAMRRRGLAGWMIREAAFWAESQGAATMQLAVTAENAPAQALYRGLGFIEIGGYCYYRR
ncbi:GNAT family N-acetyltransferase [Paracoccus sp. 12-3]|nr:GNAT family N-acetyltransferase [Paracoccus xiamenensis]